MASWKWARACCEFGFSFSRRVALLSRDAPTKPQLACRRCRCAQSVCASLWCSAVSIAVQLFGSSARKSLRIASRWLCCPFSAANPAASSQFWSEYVEMDGYGSFSTGAFESAWRTASSRRLLDNGLGRTARKSVSWGSWRLASAVCASAGVFGCRWRNDESSSVPPPSGRLRSISHRWWWWRRLSVSAEVLESAQST